MPLTQDPRNDAQQPPADELINVHAVLAICPVPASTWRTWTSRGIAPKGIKVGPRKTLWKKSEIVAFMASRAAA